MKNIFRLIVIIFLFHNTSCVFLNGGKERAYDFLIDKKYEVYYTKDSIPDFLYDSLSKINKIPFEIGDSSDIGKFNFSDIKVPGKLYDKKLSFICLSETESLICYKQGGVGIHYVIDFFEFKPKYFYQRYTTVNNLIIVKDAIKFLEGQ
jgi:hypothetical protein